MTLPERWPSAWPALRRDVGGGVATVVLTAVLTSIGTWSFGDPARAWWVGLLPLLLLVVPLSRPARYRAAFVRARLRGTVRNADGEVRVGRRRARVEPDGTVQYRR